MLMELMQFQLERIPDYGPDWRVRRINGIEQPQWWTGPGYTSLDAFFREEGTNKSWMYSAVDQGKNDAIITFGC